MVNAKICRLALALALTTIAWTTALCQGQSRFSELPGSAQARISEIVAHENGLSEKWVKISLSGSDTQSNNLFGFSVATSSDTVVVASRYFGCLEGGAYVFVKPPSGWQDMVQTAKLTGSDFGPCGGSGFDHVAIDGDTILAGPGPSGATTYVFAKPEEGWNDATETAQLTAAPSLHGMASLAISGDDVVVGYPLAGSGIAAVFVKPPSGWQNTTQPALLSASDGGGSLGWSVAIDGKEIIAGAPAADAAAGAVYVFDQPPTGWTDMTQTTKLDSPDSTQGIGWGLSLSGNVVVAPGSSVVFAFVLPGTSLPKPPTATLNLPPDSGLSSAWIHDKVIAVGGGPGYPTYYGAMFGWTEPAGGWSRASSPDFEFWGKPSGGPQMIGYSVATDGTILVAGAPGHKHDTGIVYLFAPR